MKFKIYDKDVLETYCNLTDKLQTAGIKFNDLYRIKSMDNTILKFDKDLVKKLNKIEK